MTDRTQAMDRLIAQDADLIDEDAVKDDVAKIEREAIVAWLRARFPAPEYPTNYLPLVLADAIERGLHNIKETT